MTTKPARTSVATPPDTKPAAAMMTIPDFSWQPSPLEGRPTPPLDDAGHRSDAACVSSTLKPSPTVERSGYAKWLDAARQHRNRIAVLVRGTSAMIAPLRRLKTCNRHWFPIGGVAIAILWLGSVLFTDRPHPDKAPALDGPRQAKREPSSQPQPMVKSRLRTPPADPQPTRRTAAATPALRADQQDDLFGRVPTLGGFTAADQASSDPPLSPSLNAPTDSPELDAGQTRQPPLVAPANPGQAGVAAPPAGDPVPTRTAAQPGAGHPAAADTTPASGGPTEYEWGRPISPAAPPRVTSSSEPPAAAAVATPPTVRPQVDAAASGNTDYAYPHTDPATYKDPLYEIPPLARQPRGARRQ